MWLKKRMGKLVVTLLASMPLLVYASGFATDVADKSLRLGIHAGVNKVNEVTDAPWGIYADGVGYGGTLSFDVLYRISPRFSLHSGVGVDYRYFGSDHQFLGCETENTVIDLNVEGSSRSECFWSGSNKDYLLYLEIPMLVQFHIPNILYFEAGPVFDFKLMRKKDYFDREIREDKCQEDRIAGAGLSVGFGHVFSSGFFIDAHLSFQLTDLVSIDKSCSSYTVTVWKTYLNPETGETINEKDFDYIQKIEVGSYFLINKIQLGIGYWF